MVISKPRNHSFMWFKIAYRIFEGTWQWACIWYGWNAWNLGYLTAHLLNATYFEFYFYTLLIHPELTRIGRFSGSTWNFILEKSFYVWNKKKIITRKSEKSQDAYLLSSAMNVGYEDEANKQNGDSKSFGEHFLNLVLVFNSFYHFNFKWKLIYHEKNLSNPTSELVESTKWTNRSVCYGVLYLYNSIWNILEFLRFNLKLCCQLEIDNIRNRPAIENAKC